jgi:hypothetical protein
MGRRLQSPELSSLYISRLLATLLDLQKNIVPTSLKFYSMDLKIRYFSFEKINPYRKQYIFDDVVDVMKTPDQ